MSLLRRVLFCSSLVFFQGAWCLAQGGGTPADKGDTTLSPYFLVSSEDPSTDRMPLKSTSAKVEILGVIADVKVTQVYKNEGRKALEAIYVFPGSTRAAVYGMKMTIGERVIQAQIREKGQARQEYEQAKQAGKSASLLEQQRPNVFQMNVANVLPGDEVQVELSYTELLVPAEGVYQFVYPTVVGPRYSNTPASQAAPSEKWVANPYTPQGEPPFATFHLEARLVAGMPIQKMVCDTHKTDIVFEGASIARVKLDASEKQGGNRDLILRYQLAGGQIESGLLLSRGQDENFFLLMVQPPKRVTPELIPPREYVFIMDVSGSMGGYPIETSKKVIQDLVSHLRPVDRFNILVFEAGSAAWCEAGSQPATAQNLQKALAFVGSQSGGGGTELLSGLRHALALPHEMGFSRTFVIATDGYISADYQVLDFLRQNLGEANMFAFGIGTSVNRFLIEGMAHAGMGEAFVVIRPEDAPVQAEKFRQYISTPVLTRIKVAFQGFDAYDIEPLQVPDVLAERPILCFGKWRGEAKGTITVDGLSGSGDYHQAFNVQGAAPQESGALRSLWARHRIQMLGDYGHVGGASKQAEILALGLKYGLLTDFTSFVAIDSLVRNEGGTSETVKQPLPLPQGVSNAAVGGAQVRGSAGAQIMYRIDGINANEVASVGSMAMCCASEHLDEGVSFEGSPSSSSGPRLGNVQVDGAKAQAPLREELKAKLNLLASAGLLKGLRATWGLVLHLDSTGTVINVELRGVPLHRRKVLREKLLTWRLASASGAAELRASVLKGR